MKYLIAIVLACTPVISCSGEIRSNAASSSSSSSAASARTPTQTILKSGTSATYTVPSGVTALKVRMLGGGGGSGAMDGGCGGTGITTVFGSTTSNGGNGGCGGATFYLGGTGGAAQSGDLCIHTRGANGGDGIVTTTDQIGGKGASTFLGGGGANNYNNINPGTAGGANTGAGGGGSGYASGAGSGGGAAEYVECLIPTSAGTTYTYTVGTGGTAGVGFKATAGGSGIIIIDEY